MVNMDVINEFVEALDEHTSSKNEKHFLNLKNKGNNEVIATKENLSVVMSTGIVSDLKMIIALNFISTQERYIDYIIRGLVEQVIEYKYLILKEELIEEYFGSKTHFNDELDTESDNFNASKEFRRLGGDRYINGREKVARMSRVINEYVSIDKKLSLYEIFSISSEQAHNSYFTGYLNILDNLKEEEDKKEVKGSLTEFHVALIYTIVGKFLDTYDGV